jgi:two-component system CheB/CheR fusion protein
MMSLHALITTEPAPHERQEDSLLITGPDVALTPKAGLALAMAVHELASNAAKYGALPAVSGRLEVRWTIAGAAANEILVLTWAESGGPAVHAPTRRGFGTTLIERALTHEFDAQVVGPVSRLDAAMRLAQDEPLDAAILDVRIRGGRSIPSPKSFSRATFRSCWPVVMGIGLSPRTFETSCA